jgi:hypothetical protein
MPAILAAIRAALARMAPAAIQKAAAWLTTSSGTVVSGAEGVLAFVKSNPLSAMLAFEAVWKAADEATQTLLSDAVSTADVDPQYKELTNSLKAVSKRVRSHTASGVMGLNTDSEDVARDRTRLDMARFVSQQFGSLDNFVKMQQALTTLSATDVEWAKVVGSIR